MNFDSLLGGSYESQSPLADCERTINWYPEQLQSGNATAKRALYPSPGVQTLATANAGTGRAHFAMGGREFAVIGTTLWEVARDGTLTNRGTVAIDDNPATINSSGDYSAELFITSGGNGYQYNLTTNALTQIAALNGKATMGGYIDGFFLALDANTSTLYSSNLGDGLTWQTGLYFAQRSAMPDPWLSMQVVGRNIWLFGEQTLEIWYDAGLGLMPFGLYPGSVMHYGIKAPWSPAVLGSDVVWLGTTATGKICAVRGSGYQAQVISTYPLESSAFKYHGSTKAIGDAYSDRGHTFYYLGFDQAQPGITWAWDAETNLWHERGTWETAYSRYGAWRPRYYAYAFGEHRMLDASGGNVFRMSSDLTTDADGSLIRRLRRCPVIESDNDRIYFQSLELMLEPGLGNATAPGDDPQIVLRISNDGGKTWVSEQQRSAGKIGEYQRRVRWNRLGSARRRVFEFVMTEPTIQRIVGADIQMVKGMA